MAKQPNCRELVQPQLATSMQNWPRAVTAQQNPCPTSICAPFLQQNAQHHPSCPCLEPQPPRDILAAPSRITFPLILMRKKKKEKKWVPDNLIKAPVSLVKRFLELTQAGKIVSQSSSIKPCCEVNLRRGTFQRGWAGKAGPHSGF